MISGKSVLAIIPARGGSKRFPGKNLAKIGNLTLVEIAIRVARQSKYIDRIIVSSDSEEILHIAGKHALLRPPDLATDSATSESVLHHALSLHPADLAVLLQPTSPCRTAADIDDCIAFAFNHPFGAFTSSNLTTPNGACYAIHANYQGPLSGMALAIVQMPQDRSIDIDNVTDLDEAKIALKRS